MIVELGHFALSAALGFSLLLSVIPLCGSACGHQAMMRAAKPLSVVIFGWLLLAFLALLWAFFHNDFTVNYVANNSNSALPWLYRLSAAWTAHEGSLLLWVLLQALWTVAVAKFSQHLPLIFVARVLSVLGMLLCGFLAFTLFTSDPFLRTLPFFPVDGRELNPLLQDPGLIAHPPLLYMGYVGFSVTFAFAIAALMSGQLDMAWARWSRPWNIAAWVFLTLGIAFGSWWAYHEFGWGSWWFWDPLENVSLMPWLSSVALMHMLAVTEKRGTFRAWTMLLALATFSLSLFGTLLMRSGVLVSLYSFTSDPARGLFILLFLSVVIGGSFLLYALQAGKIREKYTFVLFSRESGLLANNILLMTALNIVLLGTLLPLLLSFGDSGSVSVGAPYFDLLFSWLSVPFALLLGVGPLLRWKHDNIKNYKNILLASGSSAALLSIGLVWFFGDTFSLRAAFGCMLGIWVGQLILCEIYLRTVRATSLLAGLRLLSGSHYAMVFAHLGFAVLLVGVVLAKNYDAERVVKMELGSLATLKEYQFHFAALQSKAGPNYQAVVADFVVTNGEKFVERLEAEKRTYAIQEAVSTQAAIAKGVFRDIYVSLGEEVAENTWSVRLCYKPFVRWIWIGALLMAFGGCFALFDKRYRIAHMFHNKGSFCEK
ncbi:MAG: heme lyase CcmF/NrfE family subunit [Vibrionaceae bacterium]